MAKLSTSAWILHDLGMAAGFGGTLFGKAALDPAVKELDSRERSLVLDRAWDRFGTVEAIALGSMAATWWIGRSALSGRGLGRSMRGLVLAKDVLIGAAVVTGVLALVGGKVLRREHRNGAGSARSGATPMQETSRVARQAKKLLAVVGPLNTALIAGAIGVNAALAQESGKSSRWGALARILP